MFDLLNFVAGIYILAIPTPPHPLGGVNNFCPNWKTGKNLKEDFMKKRREKKKKIDKTHVKITLWSLNDRKKIQKKTEKNFVGGRGIFFWLPRI